MNRAPLQVDLTGQVVLLSAATSGIGLASAELAAAAGARAVIVNGRDPAAGARALERIRAAAAAEDASADFEARFVAADLTDAAQAEALCRAVLARFGRIDTFVHAGGAEISPRPFVELAASDYQPLIDGHFTAFLHCCRCIVPAMAAAGGGSIVAVASDAGKVATPGETVIGAMKAATIMFVRTLALEVSRHGIRVNCVTPSLVPDTKAHARVMASEFSRKVFEKATARARLGLPRPRDVAAMVLFLASPLSAHTTGQAVSVNGGISAA